MSELVDQKVEISMKAVEILAQLLSQCAFRVSDDVNKFREANAVWNEVQELLKGKE